MNGFLAGLGASGIMLVLAAVVNAFVNKRKLSADATKVITEAAAGVVQDMRADNAEIRAERQALVADVRQLRTEVREQNALIAVHAFWDQQVVDAAEAQGMALPPPPPLTIPKPAI